MLKSVDRVTGTRPNEKAYENGLVNDKHREMKQLLQISGWRPPWPSGARFTAPSLLSNGAQMSVQTHQ